MPHLFLSPPSSPPFPSPFLMFVSDSHFLSLFPPFFKFSTQARASRRCSGFRERTSPPTVNSTPPPLPLCETKPRCASRSSTSSVQAPFYWMKST
jgi:hypothetical protein